jgi:peptide/nickel transport system ATP-binding protein
MSGNILEIQNLVTSFRIRNEYYAAVDGVSLSIRQNEVFAIVGESGCGKSALALSILRLHKGFYSRVEGGIFFMGRDLLSLRDRELNEVRGKEIGMILQDPLAAVNPLMKIGAEIEETLKFHTDYNAEKKKERALLLLKSVGMPRPDLVYRQYPHELSGGMRQRAMIAIALVCRPALVIADEPTTALDVTIQAQILDLLRELQSETQCSVILITHDLSVVAEMAHRVAVMYAGQIVETADVADLFHDPLHPYTRLLLESNPSLGTPEDGLLHVIEGMVPSIDRLPRSGCRFSPRLPWMESLAHEAEPAYHTVAPGHIVLCTCYEHWQPPQTPKSRLATEAKAEFTTEVNEHFAERSNAEFGVFGGCHLQNVAAQVLVLSNTVQFFSDVFRRYPDIFRPALFSLERHVVKERFKYGM